MPKPKLPDSQRKDIKLQIRFDQSEMKIIIQKAKMRKCKTISQYFRQLINEDRGKGLDILS
jgi:hypothetical protein